MLLLAHDVGSWQDGLNTSALQFQASPEAPVSTTASTILPSGWSADVLAVGSDRDWLHALQEFAVVRQSTARLNVLGPGAYKLLNSGEAALRPETQDTDPSRASQAYNLLAALTFREALTGTGIVHNLVQTTLADLQSALRLDPDNEQARENFELVLRYVTVALPPEQRPSRGLGKQASKYPKGGYAGPPGEGY